MTIRTYPAEGFTPADLNRLDDLISSLPVGSVLVPFLDKMREIMASGQDLVMFSEDPGLEVEK